MKTESELSIAYRTIYAAERENMKLRLLLAKTERELQAVKIQLAKTTWVEVS